jgi:hypothetical protein
MISPAKPLRIGPDAVLVPDADHTHWLEQVSAMPLSRFELAVARALADYLRRRQRGSAAKLSLESMANDLGSSPRSVSAAVGRLIDLGLLALRRGSGQKGSQYLPCLPRHTVITAALAAAAPAPL